MGEVIAIISGKGGQGTTSVAACIGAGLSNLGKRVLMIDLDFGMRNLDLPLGMDNMIIHNIMDTLENKCELNAAVVQNRKYNSLVLLAAPLTKGIESLDAAKLSEKLFLWKNQFDYIILDVPSGIGHGYHVASEVSDRMIAVLSPDVAGIRATDKLISVLSRTKKDGVSLVINMISAAYIKNGTQIGIEDMADVLPQPVIGVLPYSTAVYEAIAGADLPVMHNGKIGSLYQQICRRILGENISINGWEKAAKANKL